MLKISFCLNLERSRFDLIMILNKIIQTEKNNFCLLSSIWGCGSFPEFVSKMKSAKKYFCPVYQTIRNFQTEPSSNPGREVSKEIRQHLNLASRVERIVEPATWDRFQ